MPERKWTPEQLNAVNFGGGDILVAAGAGSGKTSVLVERVLRLIGARSAGGRGEPEPAGIDRLLVVTFTTAAAAEMKERIAAALTDELDNIESAQYETGGEDVSGDRTAMLRRQTMLLDGAYISTIHSFCLKIIKDNVNLIEGLDSGFRLMDDAEAALLRADALDEVLEERYADEKNGAFIKLVESYGMGRDDRKAAEVILKTYNFSQSAPWPAEWLYAMAELFNIRTEREFGDSVWARRTLELLAGELDTLTAALRHYRDILYDCAVGRDGIENLEDTAEQIENLRRACYRALNEKTDADTAPKTDIGAVIQAAAPPFTGWTEIRAAVLRLGDMPALCPKARKGEDEEHKNGREAVKNAVRCFSRDFANKFFKLEFADIADEFAKSYELLSELSSTVNAFSEKYAAMKRDRAVADYNDLEHFALRILLTRDPATGQTAPSEAAEVYRRKFAEVLVDEYQDINLVQEHIIRAVSGGGVFMVGDVKQSIYRFRQAMPEIFMGKYQSYKRLDAGDSRGVTPISPASHGVSSGTKILLYRNFRSDPRILDFVNAVFSSIMAEKAGGLDYSEEEWLLPGTGAQDNGIKSTAQNPPEPPVEVHVVSKKPAAALPEDSAAGSEYESDAAETEEAVEDIGNAEIEARLIAQKIYKIKADMRISGPDGGDRPLMYGDIAILIRAVRGVAHVYRDELARLGVPAYTESGASYFEKYEISVMVSLLKIIDNPLQDIPLFTVMLSPVFSFTAEEAVFIRQASDRRNPDGRTAGDGHIPLYDCLRETASTDIANTGGEQNDLDAAIVEKARGAVAAIGGWRRLSAEKPVSGLIWFLMHETGFYLHACAMPGGEQRRANLLKLFEYARMYEKISYKGIFSFLRFIDNMIGQGEDLAEARLVGGNADGVRIISVHKSKGLEFPVVFLAGCGRNINLREAAEQMLLHRDMGFGPEYVDLERRIIDDTLAKKLISSTIRTESLSEEMRVLYVALTRAKNKLYLVGTLADAGVFYKRLEKQLAPYTDFTAPADGTGLKKLPPEYTLKAGNYLFWILSSLAENTDFPVITHSAEDFYEPEHESGPPASGFSQPEPPASGVLPDGSSSVLSDDSSSVLSDDSPDVLPDDFYESLDARLNWEYPYGWLSDIPRKVSVTDVAEAQTSPRRYFITADDEGDGGSADETPVYSTGRETDAVLAVPKFLAGIREFTPAQIGTFTHLVLEKMDFTGDTGPGAVEDTIYRLVENKTLLPEQAAAVNRRAIANFFNTEAGKLAAGAGHVNRETIFTVKLSLDEYADLTRDPRQSKLPVRPPSPVSQRGRHSAPTTPPRPDEPEPEGMPFVLMQGSVDCWFDTPEGLIIIDYKTGFTADGKIPTERYEKYKRQIELYALALKKITGKDAYRMFICLLTAGACIEI